MPLYVHEVDARVVPDDARRPAGGLGPEDFQRILTAVLQELERRQQQSRTHAADAAITGSNRPPSLGG
jgi:hypothetical protein